MSTNELPEIGTKLTYGEAIAAYDRFEQDVLRRSASASP